MTLAAETRAAVRDRPFLLAALRAGVVNYAAAARTLDVGEDPDAVATALRRFAERLPAAGTTSRSATVAMRSGLERVDPGNDAVLRVGEQGFGPGAGDRTGLVATGEVDAVALGHVLGVLDAHDITVEAAGAASGALVVVVPRRDGPDALRRVEGALDAVPDVP